MVSCIWKKSGATVGEQAERLMLVVCSKQMDHYSSHLLNTLLVWEPMGFATMLDGTGFQPSRDKSDGKHGALPHADIRPGPWPSKKQHYYDENSVSAEGAFHISLGRSPRNRGVIYDQG